jgi:ElaB/YqjD/DUF883 family membrane-anchored ribosome-binding protein
MEAHENEAPGPVAANGEARGVSDHTIASTSRSGTPVVDRMTAGAHEAVDKISSVANHAVDTLGVKSDQLTVAEKRLVAGTRQYVQDHPVASLGIAIATGYFLSRMFASR